MISKKYISLGVLFMAFSVNTFAQIQKPLSLEEVKFMEAVSVSLDSAVIDMEIGDQMTFMEQSDGLENEALSLMGAKKKFNLKDHPEASKYDSLWIKEMYDSAALFESIYSEVSNLEIDSVYHYSLDTETLKERLEILNQKTPFNIAYNPSLENVIKSFLTRKRGFMERMLTLSQFYFPMFEQELDNYNIPLEIKYLAIVESALNPRAKSRVGATGLWQFMYGTGKMYNLDVSSYVDERSDPIASTKAACKYLSKLYDIFGDWDLALAAYNSGPGNVNKAIRRSGGQKNYWNIRQNLPRETAGYVPAFLTVMYLFEYAEEHGLRGLKVERPFFETDTVHVKNTITFNQISELVDIDLEELKIMNPSYKLDVIPYVKGKNYTLRLPSKTMGRFVANEDEIYAHVKTELKYQEAIIPQLVNQSQDDHIRYKVQSGDFLGRIADKHGVSVNDIKNWNGLRSNNLKVGQRLIIYSKKSRGNTANIAVAASKPSATDAIQDAKVHTVKQGDSLWTISKKYPGISIENLREWNGISGNDLKPGTKLKLCNCSS